MQVTKQEHEGRGRLPLPLPSPAVDRVAVEARAAALAKRSIKKQAKRQGLELSISMMDLTTLEGSDTPGKVQALCRKALLPDASRPSLGPVAAVCVYPQLVGVAKKALGDSGVNVASVATAFPSGLSALDVRLDDTRRAIGDGADEIDMVIDRGAFLRGEFNQVSDAIAAVKQVCGDVHLKVILETGELGSYDNVRHASDLALAAGTDFIKTSTGKIEPAATPPVTLV
ncbi:MAG: deoxyribose-phosphate aldolase, partial [Myxococcales bacterium]|nr:deoxyribose-phosphate aldolase [Myxococcales bacterium]